jgi:hypothetical protein
MSAPYPVWLAGERDFPLSLISATYRATGHCENMTIWQGRDEEPESAVVE